MIQGKWPGYPDYPSPIPGREGFLENSDPVISLADDVLIEERNEGILFSLASFLDGDTLVH